MHDDTTPSPLRSAEVTDLGVLTMRSERDAAAAHVIALAGELDLSNAQAVEDELRRVEATDARSIVLDLSSLEFIDSTGIRLVVTADARLRQDSERLRLVRGTAAVQRVFEMTGLATRLPFAG